MEWYQKPKMLGKAYWSDPYYDEGGGEMTMATYSLPLFDHQGQMYAVVTADISLDWLTRRLEEIDQFNNDTNYKFGWSDIKAYSFIISRNGSYIVHPDKKRILNENYFKYAEATKDTIDDWIGSEMISGKQGVARFSND
jgi:sigma-B regulation protein RsbU (phosphoserine phosphatase)